MSSPQWDQFPGGRWSFLHSEKCSCLDPVSKNIVGAKIESQKKHIMLNNHCTYATIFFNRKKKKGVNEKCMTGKAVISYLCSIFSCSGGIWIVTKRN